MDDGHDTATVRRARWGDWATCDDDRVFPNGNTGTAEVNKDTVPYILFYTAEHHSVHVSGILALVAMGLYMTNIGRMGISTESEKAIEHIWHYIGFVAETLIFMLTGIVLGTEFVTDAFEPIWVLQLVALYVCLHIIRFLGLVMLLPLMRLSGYSFNMKQVLLLTYSGLRGAVGLCLALIVKFKKEIKEEL